MDIPNGDTPDDSRILREATGAILLVTGTAGLLGVAFWINPLAAAALLCLLLIAAGLQLGRPA